MIPNIFAIRHRSGGFYYPNCHVDGRTAPRTYRTVGLARGVITRRFGKTSYGRKDTTQEYEIVELELHEVVVHMVSPPKGRK